MTPLSADPSQSKTRTLQAGSLGEWCVRRGLASAAQVEDCLAIQREEERAGRVAPRLGELLVRKGLLTPAQVAEALSDQQTEIRSCPRCAIQVNVSLREDAAWYRCSRCQGPLVAPESSARLDVVDEAAIVVSRDPLPSDVQIASRIPERRFGKYILLTELGSGGVGRVDLAWDTFLSQYVALKRLLPRTQDETPQMAEMWIYSLLKEARHSIRLRHPGIVSVFDVGRINREYYIAMEYLEGETLHARLVAARNGGHMSPFYEHPKQVLRMLVDVARAVHYAHTRPSPIIHCDLKPANILITRDGRAHVFDFGLARNVHLEREEEGEISGTPSYMAPEQAAGKTAEIDARTDVWALGAILYEMLTGQPPFVGSAFEILHRTIHERPRPIVEAIHDTTKKMKRGEISTRMLVQVPPFLEELCMKCLTQDKIARPSTMAEVADLLENGMMLRVQLPAPGPTPLPSPAPAASAGPATPPAARRSRPLALAFGIVAALAAAGLYMGFAASRSAESRVASELALFRPANAVAAAAGSDLAEDAQAVARLHSRLVARLAAAPRDVAELRLRDRTIRSVRLESADAEALSVSSATSKLSVPWSDLEPSQLIGLALLVLPEPDDVDRLALGAYCWCVGRKTEAREYLQSIRKGSEGARAERLLKRIDK
jgi:serine/threonine protein kinase